MAYPSGTPLKDIPWEELHVGMEVRSACGKPGKITALHPAPEEDRYDSVDFEWDDGNVSRLAFHSDLSQVTVM